MIDFKSAEFIKLHAVDKDAYLPALEPMLVPGEAIVASFRSVRDGVVFTDKRVIAINVQGVTGKKTDYTSLPYRRIQAFSVETAGVADLDGELILWFSGLGQVRFELFASADIRQLASVIAQHAL